MEKVDGNLLSDKPNDSNTSVKYSRNKNLSNKRYLRAYRISLKHTQNDKDRKSSVSSNEHKSSDDIPVVKDPNEMKSDTSSLDEYKSIVNSTESRTEMAASCSNNDSPSSSRKSRFVKFWSCSDVEALQVHKPNKTSPDSKKSKAANRRKNRNMRKKAENKDILDNILACIILMEENLSKFDEETDHDTIDSSKCIKSEDTSKDQNESPLNKQKQKRRRGRRSSKNEDQENKDQNDEPAESGKLKESPKQPIKTRFQPTHFLALRHQNPEIRKNVDSIQENILNINKDFRAGFINTSLLYSTLAVMELNDEEEIHKALKGIELSLGKINDVYKNSTAQCIEFETLGSFKDQFLFMNMKETESLTMLQSMVSIIKERMLAQELLIRKDMFSAHSTILKLRNRYTLRRKGITRIPSSMYEEQKNDYFGKEEITELVFCSLTGKKEGEFHKVLATMDLKNNELRIS